jgi:hypothetical protein
VHVLLPPPVTVSGAQLTEALPPTTLPLTS